VTATGAPAELETDIVAAHETDDTDTPLLTLSTCDDCSSGETQGETPSPPVSEAPLFGPPPPAELSAPAHGAASAVAERSADHRKAKLVVRNPSQHAARPPHPNRRSAPLNKAALLRALRSS
jgi:hypothetical protein